MSTRNEIHVISAGLAGLTAAAFVARAGLPVVVHESRDRLGGRATTDDRAGFRFDQGPMPSTGVVQPSGCSPNWASDPGGWHRKRVAWWCATGGSTVRPPAEHAHRTAEEWIEDTVQDARARELLAMLVRLTTYNLASRMESGTQVDPVRVNDQVGWYVTVEGTASVAGVW